MLNLLKSKLKNQNFTDPKYILKSKNRYNYQDNFKYLRSFLKYFLAKAKSSREIFLLLLIETYDQLLKKS